MSETERDDAQISGITPDGAEVSAPVDAGAQTDESALGDAGKKALQALRAEVKELKAKLKAQESADAERDASDDADSSTSDTGDPVTVEPTPKPRRFQGTADGGAANRGSSTAGRQLSKDDLRSMSPAAIDKARRAGQLRDLLRGN
ncbi:hypothetical protein ACFU5O_22245 [Streptomyces sp. NPDC057445]|uniref:hypothetical protein n=1 Tax=Streptomyces sp. NPDC057445 TaxID=3346136 RepID=UPI0036869AEE